MMETSPFALATAAVAVEAPKDSFTANWSLTGLMKMPDAEGVPRDYVAIRSRDQRVSFSLLGEEESSDPEAEGVKIDHIEWNAGDAHKTRVFLRKGTEVAPVEFSQEAAAATAAPGAPGMPQPGRPTGVPGGLPGGNRGPMLPTPSPLGPGRPNANGLLQRPPNPLVRPPTGLPRPNGIQGSGPRPAGPAPAPGIQQNGQKKIRVIPSS
jgi:hypothetical protein